MLCVCNCLYLCEGGSPPTRPPYMHVFVSVMLLYIMNNSRMANNGSTTHIYIYVCVYTCVCAVCDMCVSAMHTGCSALLHCMCTLHYFNM